MAQISEKTIITERDRTSLIASIFLMEGPEQEKLFDLLEYLQREQREVLRALITTRPDELEGLRDQLTEVESDIDSTQEYLKKLITINNN